MLALEPIIMPTLLCHLLKPCIEQIKSSRGQIHLAHRLPVLQTLAKGIKCQSFRFSSFNSLKQNDYRTCLWVFPQPTYLWSQADPCSCYSLTSLGLTFTQIPHLPDYKRRIVLSWMSLVLTIPQYLPKVFFYEK